MFCYYFLLLYISKLPFHWANFIYSQIATIFRHNNNIIRAAVLSSALQYLEIGGVVGRDSSKPALRGPGAHFRPVVLHLHRLERPVCRLGVNRERAQGVLAREFHVSAGMV